jgi:hypothetical protein
VIGTIFGGFASYVELQPTLKQRALHTQFARLSGTKAVVSKIDILKTAPDFIPAPDDPKTGPWAKYAAKSGQTPQIDPRTGERLAASAQVKEYDPWELAAAESGATVINKGGVRSIHWTKDHGIESIDTEEGETLFPTPAPPAWKYLLVALFPIFGFLIPWSAVRAIGWVAAGFFQRTS